MMKSQFAVWMVAACGALLVSPLALADGTPAKWVKASAKPSGSGIVLRYDAPQKLSVGQVATLRLRFENVVSEGATVDVKAPAGVTVERADGAPLAGTALPRGSTTIDLHVMPQSDGLHYLDVFTRQGGRMSAQSVALKVGSGAPAFKRNGTVQTTPSGEQVISLPAQR